MNMNKKGILISIAVIAAVALAFHFYSRQQGYIKIDTAGVEMQIRSRWFDRTRIASGAEPVTVSARVYRPKRLSIAAKQGGDTWRINSSGPWGKLAKIRVKNNETTVLKLGPPFSVKPDVRRRGKKVLIGLSIIGRAGEHYSALVMKNGRHQAAPKSKIMDESGKIIASGKFEYG